MKKKEKIKRIAKSEKWNEKNIKRGNKKRKESIPSTLFLFLLLLLLLRLLHHGSHSLSMFAFHFFGFRLPYEIPSLFSILSPSLFLFLRLSLSLFFSLSVCLCLDLCAFFFSRVNATLEAAMSVGRSVSLSVGLSVGNFFEIKPKSSF